MRKHITPSVVISLIALTLSVMGAGYAVTSLPRDSVGKAQIKPGAVGSSEVADGSLKPVDFSKAALAKMAGVPGPKGETGPAGAAGPSGSGGAATGGCELVLNPTPTHFTDCRNDRTTLWGRDVAALNAGFRYANFDGSDLSFMNFQYGDLRNASFRGSTLRGTDFREANLSGADLTNADLTRYWGPTSTLNSSTVVTGTIWANTTCPDGTNSDNNGNTCVGHY